jgi:hypothetical protein
LILVNSRELSGDRYVASGPQINAAPAALVRHPLVSVDQSSIRLNNSNTGAVARHFKQSKTKRVLLSTEHAADQSCLSFATQ